MKKIKIDNLLNNQIEEKAMNMIAGGGTDPGGCCVVCGCACDLATDQEYNIEGDANHGNGVDNT